MNPPRRSSLIAGLAGLALLAVSFMTWYRAGGASADLWESFDAIDVVAACAIASAVLTGLAALAGDGSGLPVAVSSVTTGVAAITLVLLAWRLIDPPGSGDVERAAGAWLGLLAAAGIAGASYGGMQEWTEPSG